MANKKDEIEELYASNFLWGEFIDYKGIKLYPICCSEIEQFYSSIYALLYDPLRFNGEISTLPRLYFLTDILNYQDDADYIRQHMFLLQLFIQLQLLLKLTLKDQNFEFKNNKNKWYLQITTIENSVINVKAKDFDKIREIILHQNGVEYDDTFIHEDIRQWIEQQEENDKSSSPTIEDYVEAFMLQTGSCDIENIKSVSLRRFNRIIEKMLSRENYNIQMTASMSGFVTFKNEIDHWIAINKKNSIYDKYFKELK